MCVLISFYFIDAECAFIGKRGCVKFSGMGAGFVPKVLKTDIYEEIITVKSDEAIAMAKRLAAEEGILCGMTIF